MPDRARKKSNSGTSIERIALAAARAAGLQGLRCQATDLPGTPDVVSEVGSKTAIFAHGCYWHFHGCALSRVPVTNRDFWTRKFSDNKARDQRVTDALLDRGWRVIWVWECTIRHAPVDDIAETMRQALSADVGGVEIIPAHTAADP